MKLRVQKVAEAESSQVQLMLLAGRVRTARIFSLYLHLSLLWFCRSEPPELRTACVSAQARRAFRSSGAPEQQNQSRVRCSSTILSVPQAASRRTRAAALIIIIIYCTGNPCLLVQRLGRGEFYAYK